MPSTIFSKHNFNLGLLILTFLEKKILVVFLPSTIHIPYSPPHEILLLSIFFCYLLFFFEYPHEECFLGDACLAEYRQHFGRYYINRKNEKKQPRN